ncbi:hypothetical protein [Leptospira saintgironsiae]|uniref:hypothetical protein n=1 Tax=Leptospira saintgironsiae TaxID=2023183 RepID=UPI001FCC49DF|nr:hypothetical protein [Leptospira saintgironsiae]
MLIASLALGSSSAFAEEGSDIELSSQNMSEAEEFISEELKSIYQEEVDQILSEGISYSEEERLSDFPDLDSLLADDGAPGRVAKISSHQKTEKGKNPNSELGIQNRKSTSENFSESSIFSQNCLLSLNVLLSNMNVGQGLGLEFLPSIQAQGRTRDHETSFVIGDFYADAVSGCESVISLYLSGEGSLLKSVCSAENQRNLLLGPGVPATNTVDSGKTAENALGTGLSPEFDQIGGITLVFGKFYESRIFYWESAGQRRVGGSSMASTMSRAGALTLNIKFSAEKLEAQTLNPELKSSLEKVTSARDETCYKFSSGRPTPEILT